MPARATASTFAVLLCTALAACKSAPVDPTANVPLRPVESARAGERPPAALAPALGNVPADERAPHTATRIMLSDLSQIERDGSAPAVIELRIDALDEKRAAAVLAGDLRVIVRCDAADPCYLAFDAMLATKRQVAQHTDPTLGQVVILLEPRWEKEPARGDPMTITATFTGLDGKVIESTLRLAW